MRRGLAARAGLVSVLIVSSLTAAGGAAGATVVASAPKSQDRPSSTWVQPGTAPLDGLGAYVYVAPPTPGASQASPLGYEYTLGFGFQDGSGGILALGYRNGHRVAGFGLLPSHLVATVPFDWAFGQIYFLLTYRLGPSQWGAWVYDWSATNWTYIGQQEAPTGAGGILPTSTTGVDYDPTLAPVPAADQRTCAFYPRVDAYLYPPIGWRGSDMTLGTRGGNTVVKGDCPSATTTELGWQHYALGEVSPA